MSKFSNHAVVYTKLILDGKPFGVHAFLVQTRDLVTYEPMAGIEMGDIGPKLGYNSKDNGFMLFKNVRIPKSNMLKRYAEVDTEGKLQLKGDLRALYAVMLGIRVWITGYSAQNLAIGLTIGTRYAVNRRQFSTQDGTKQERKILDYQTHMFKYAPLLAQAFAMNFSSAHLNKIHEQLKEDLKTANYSKLDLTHHLSAGFKAVYSRLAYDGIDSIR